MRNGYIEECIINQHTVNIITMNGFQMVCKILEEEADHIVVNCGYKKRMVYKHAISTIEPANKERNVNK